MFRCSQTQSRLCLDTNDETHIILAHDLVCVLSLESEPSGEDWRLSYWLVSGQKGLQSLDHIAPIRDDASGHIMNCLLWQRGSVFYMWALNFFFQSNFSSVAFSYNYLRRNDCVFTCPVRFFSLFNAAIRDVCGFILALFPSCWMMLLAVVLVLALSHARTHTHTHSERAYKCIYKHSAQSHTHRKKRS